MISGAKTIGRSVDAATATTATFTPIAVHQCRQFGWIVTGAGTVTGGTLLIEASDEYDYTGTWQLLDTLAFATTALTDAKYIANYPNPFGGFIRGRISGTVTGGGTVTVDIQGIVG